MSTNVVSPLSDVKTVNVPNFYSVNVYPNPVRDNLTLNYNSVGTGDISIKVISISGAEAMPVSNITNIQTGKNVIPLNTFSLAKGMYIIEVANEAQTYYKKFIKQ